MQQIIPLPEAADLMVQLRRREQAARTQSTSGRDVTRYIIETPDEATPPLAKRQAIRTMVTELASRGVAATAIKSVLPNATFLSVDGELEGAELEAAFLAKFPNADLRRWFLDDPILDVGTTWVLSKMWGLQTEQVLTSLAALAPTSGVSYLEA